MRLRTASTPSTCVAAMSVGLAAALAACGSSSSKTTTATATGVGSAAAVTTTVATSKASFTLEEGFEHDVCGIGVIVKFIPPSASASKADEAVLVGGPVSNVRDTVQNQTGDQPLPANAAQLTAGATVTVVGKKFKVDALNTAKPSVDLEALC